MLLKIPLLTGLIFGAVYPLCFWISGRDPLRNNFHRFHLGLANVSAGLSTVVVFLTAIPSNEKFLLVVWLVTSLVVSCFYWNKPYPDPKILTIPSCLGIFAALRILSLWLPVSWTGQVMTVVGGLVLSSAIFAMNLGHWYLNVHGLPIHHLRRAVYVFWILVALRAVCDLVGLLEQSILYDGEFLPFFRFVFHIEGFLLILAILFGTVFPLIGLYFVKGTIDVKSTQSATGILYVILSAVLIGDFTYKYYLLRFGIAL